MCVEGFFGGKEVPKIFHIGIGMILKFRGMVFWHYCTTVPILSSLYVPVRSKDFFSSFVILMFSHGER